MRELESYTVEELKTKILKDEINVKQYYHGLDMREISHA